MINDAINDKLYSELKDKCGIFASFNSKNAVRDVFSGLHSLQHRGQEGAGIVSNKNKIFRVKKYEGTVYRNFSESDLTFLSGNSDGATFHAIGHVRYSTSGSKDSDKSIQPFFKEEEGISVAVAHNGNLINCDEIREKVAKAGVVPDTTIDTELILHLIFISNKPTLKEKIIDAISQIKGAFSLLILTKDFLCVVRDENGIRPLCMGRGQNNEIYFSSESCGLDSVSATFERNIKNGEVVFVSNEGVESVFPFASQKHKFCIFEYVYFSRPDSILESGNVYNVRKEIGRTLARESSVEADIVIGVPDSGIPASIGYSLESKIPFELGIIRSHYIGRTFIDPSQKVRVDKVKLKHNPNRAVIEGKKIILIDDSIVRGTTSKKIVSLLFEFGAKEVHMRIASPPTKYSCFYGIDTPDSKDLIAHTSSVEEIRKAIGATTLSFISLQGLKNSIDSTKKTDFCDACFTGDYFVKA